MYDGWADVYRARWTWDKVGRSTHFVNCWPQAHCAWNVYMKDGIVWREEQAGDSQIVAVVEDYNALELLGYELPSPEQIQQWGYELGVSDDGVPASSATPTEPGQVPTVPGQVPTVPGQVPTVPGQVPGQAPTLPGQVSGQVPAVPGQVPAQVPGQIPGQAPPTMPGWMPTAPSHPTPGTTNSPNFVPGTGQPK